MISLLLAIIYLSFISLGLPDTILGAAWPSMQKEFMVPISYAGIISMIIAGGTIISSLFSDKLIRRLGTGMVTAISVGMTAAALFGFSLSNSFMLLCICAVPYGLGAGAVDAALNNYVALHYSSKHMNWLHCFWGIGATLGPAIMGMSLTKGWGWNRAYQSISLIQILLTIILIFTLSFWNRNKGGVKETTHNTKGLTLREVLKFAGAKHILVGFFCYCAIEATVGLWGSSYMTIHRGISVTNAASWSSLFYLGITFGRFLSGCFVSRIGDRNMVRIGQGIGILGVLVLLIPAHNVFVMIGLVLIGLGCAPIYPSLLHETPSNFGEGVSQSIMGMQMASAYVGSTFIPPLFGMIAEHINIRIFPAFVIVLFILMILMVERVNHIKKRECN